MSIQCTGGGIEENLTCTFATYLALALTDERTQFYPLSFSLTHQLCIATFMPAAARSALFSPVVLLLLRLLALPATMFPPLLPIGWRWCVLVNGSGTNSAGRHLGYGAAERKQ